MAEPSEHRPHQPASAASAPIKSAPVSVAEPAVPESPCLSQHGRAQPDWPEPPAQASKAVPEPPEHVRRAEWPVPQAQAEPRAAAPHAAMESMAAKNVQSTMEDAEAEPGAQAVPEPPRLFSLPVLSRRAPQPELPPSPPQASLPAAREPVPQPLRRDGNHVAKQQAQLRPEPRHAPAAGPATLRRRRASWSASSCRQCPAPPTSRESRWALLRARGPAH
jgi:hypothetical protein